MAEPTCTRQAIRRAIGMRTRMPFFLSYGEDDLTLSLPTTTAAQATDGILAAKLTQPENWWENSWVWLSDSAGIYGTERRIQSFERAAHKLIPEYVLDSAPADDASIELFHTWSPSAIHSAINTAIEEGGENWPEQVTDESMILVEDRMRYDVSGLSKTLWKPSQVWVERAHDSVTGYCTSACTSAIAYVDSDDDLSDIDTDWFLSIYDGTGKGQLRSVISGDTATNAITVGDSASNYLSPTPDSTSKYRWWDADEQWHDWGLMTRVHWDHKEYPDQLQLNSPLNSSAGFRIRLVYLAWPGALSADTDETVVPKEYLVNKTISLLHDSLIGDNRFDRQMHGGNAQYYNDLAETYAMKHRRRVPAGTLWSDDEGTVTGVAPGDNIGNPLDWG